MKRWLIQILVALDQLVNALLGGMADETLSSRAWRSRDHKYWFWMHPLLDWLVFWEADHCRTAYESEQERKHLPTELRGNHGTETR